MIAAGELILAPARRVMSERALALPARHVRIEAARFGAESGMLGAALFARERSASECAHEAEADAPQTSRRRDGEGRPEPP